ncbi:MAG: SIS domain-containing protein [Candidatus Kerfeldbacteria bacterium]
MSSLLDRIALYRSTPRALTLASLERFGEQCSRGYRGGRAVGFPSAYGSVNSIVVCGMGGSALGTDVIKSVFFSSLPVPLTIVNGYHIPHSVNKKTLVVLSSYSGNTEEVMSAAAEAKRTGARITGLTAGGKLAAFFRRHRLPWYQIDGKANPSGQPRMGLGYSVMGQVGLFSRMKLLRVSGTDIRRCIAHIGTRATKLGPMIVTDQNEAKSLAGSLFGRFPILIGAEHLVGSMHVFANQLNETAKVFATYFPLPELNHHLLEGLRFPREIRSGTIVCARSSLYDAAVTKRLRITADIALRKGLRSVSFSATGQDPLSQALDSLVLSGYTSFYLSVLNRVNPLEISAVDEFKKRLAR